MSLVIAFKDKDRFILGADKQISWGFDKKSHNGTKIWKTQINENDYYCMGAVGSARASQIISEDSNFMKMIPFGTTSFPPGFATIGLPSAIHDILEDNGIIVDLDDDHQKHQALPCSFFFAYHDHCWLINQDMTVEEVEEYAAIGSGGDRAETAMDYAVLVHEDSKKAFNLISDVITLVAYRTLYVDNEIDFLTTEPRENDELEKLDATDPEAAELLRAEIKKMKEEEKAKKAKEKEAAKKAKEKVQKKAVKKQLLVENLTNNEVSETKPIASEPEIENLEEQPKKSSKKNNKKNA